MITPREGLEALVFKRFDAQLGELGWHSITADDRLDEVSDATAERMLSLLDGRKKPRVLELGAYAHHSAQIVATRTGGLGVSHDISPTSLAAAVVRAAQRGFDGRHMAVAGDFHDLPFADDSFDLVFVASSIHHTRTPWVVLQEMIRVCRPGGLVRIENEPAAREACLYQYRGNRTEERTPFEQELERLGLTQTVSSPFPGSRSEQLFGMVENDRIPISIYEDTLKAGGDLVEWSIDSRDVIRDFERWLLNRPASEIVARLTQDLAEAGRAFSERDRLSGFSLPSVDALWSLAYRVEKLARNANTDRLTGELFGAVVKATLMKPGRPALFRSDPLKRKLRNVGGVLIDQPADPAFELRLDNLTDPPAFPPSDWSCSQTPDGISVFANHAGYASIAAAPMDGVLILRVYSVVGEKPYVFNAQVDGRPVYAHCVVSTESHLAKFLVRRGESVTISHHDQAGEPVQVPMHSHIAPRFVEVRETA